MRKIIFAFAAISFFGIIQAQNVTVSEAELAAVRFLKASEPSRNMTELSLYKTFADNDGNNVFYLFNIGNSGFIAFGADRMFDPLIGYSFSGAYDSTSAAPGLKAWLNSFVQDVSAVRKSATKSNETIKYHNKCKKQWDDLLSGNTDELKTKSSKGVENLLVTKWDQGGGYNNYCPSYSYGPNGHSYTGCVATAMAQIIRYHEYPTTGFSRSSYVHYYHGYQYAAYDSVVFDFSKMPQQVSRTSSQVFQHNVSLLCYYCGVSVKMNYLNPTHTTGSGAHSEDVPEGLKYFGYTNAFYMNKTSNIDYWDSLIRNDLDNSRPIYYSGADNDGGHAFVLEGYRENGTYQFNFGWSGSGDGFFTISHVGGFSTGQAAVFNIVPSYFAPLGDTIFIAAEGEGGGTSWEDASPNLQDAIRLAKLCNKNTIWVKNGIYTGNNSSPYSFEMESGVTIYGGFSGTETSLDQRSGTGESVMSGNGKRIAFYSPASTSNAAVYDMTFADGYADNGAGATLMSGVRLERCTIRNNTATNGAALYSFNNTIYNCFIHNNNGGGANLTSNSSLRNSLVAHNDGYGIKIEKSTINGCDIVCNSDTGLINDNWKAVRSSVIWNNGVQLSNDSLNNIFFCAIEGIGEKDSNSNFGLSHENRPADGIGPYFMNPNLTIGHSDTLGDWHISSLSPLVNAGDTVRSGAYIRDLDNDNRFRNGRMDIGCYEWIPGNAIQNASSTTARIYPNPATTSITIEGISGQGEIYDIMGRCVKTVDINQETTIININNLTKGLYLIRINGKTTKFIKQ